MSVFQENTKFLIYDSINKLHQLYQWVQDNRGSDSQAVITQIKSNVDTLNTAIQATSNMSTLN